MALKELNEEKPSIIYIHVSFLNEAGFVKSGKIKGKKDILVKVVENQGKSDKTRKRFCGLQKFVFSRLSQGVY